MAGRLPSPRLPVSELGNLTHAVTATAGLSAVIAASATAFGIIKWAGAVYLVGVGLNTLVRRPDAVTLSIDHLPRRRAFSQGVIVNVLNPKVALFFLSICRSLSMRAVGQPGRRCSPWASCLW